jgi:hypothetical protein
MSWSVCPWEDFPDKSNLNRIFFSSLLSAFVRLEEKEESGP